MACNFDIDNPKDLEELNRYLYEGGVPPILDFDEENNDGRVEVISVDDIKDLEVEEEY